MGNKIKYYLIADKSLIEIDGNTFYLAGISSTGMHKTCFDHIESEAMKFVDELSAKKFLGFLNDSEVVFPIKDSYGGKLDFVVEGYE